MSTRPTASVRRFPRGSPAAIAARRIMIAWLILLAIVAAGLFGILRYFESQSLSGKVRRGLEMLHRADSPALVREALDRWEADLRPFDPAGRDALIEHLFTSFPLSDPAVRVLLSRVSNADYGSRLDDWKRWYENHERLQRGQPPRAPTGQAVRLTPLWKAPVGLTAWFSTITPLGGDIFVASLGEMSGVDDPSDGVVRVDGRTGDASLFFSPPAQTGRGPRDVVGVAAARDGLFVACLNGNVYLVGDDGAVRWQQHVGTPTASIPLSFDINGDGADDLIIATRAGQVVALSGQTGRTAWTAGLSKVPVGYELLGVWLTLADVLPGQGLELIACSPLGDVEVLNARTGKARYRTSLSAGARAAPLVRERSDETPAPPLFVGDGAARVWAFAQTRDGLEPLQWAVTATSPSESLIAGLRATRAWQEAPMLVIACPSDYEQQRSAVAALTAEGQQWRFPVAGSVWATPAVADVNGDRREEILVGTIEHDASGNPLGGVFVLSGDGHLLHRSVIEAAVASAPVVSDVNGDERLEVLFADQSGWLHCLATGVFGPVSWGLVAGDSHNTGSAENAFAFGQTPFRLQRAWRPGP